MRLLRRIGRIGRARQHIDALNQQVADVARAAFEARHAHVETYDIPAFLRRQAD